MPRYGPSVCRRLDAIQTVPVEWNKKEKKRCSSRTSWGNIKRFIVDTRVAPRSLVSPSARNRGLSLPALFGVHSLIITDFISFRCISVYSASSILILSKGIRCEHGSYHTEVSYRNVYRRIMVVERDVYERWCYTHLTNVVSCPAPISNAANVRNKLRRRSRCIRVGLAWMGIVKDKGTTNKTANSSRGDETVLAYKVFIDAVNVAARCFGVRVEHTITLFAHRVVCYNCKHVTVLQRYTDLGTSSGNLYCDASKNILRFIDIFPMNYGSRPVQTRSFPEA